MEASHRGTLEGTRTSAHAQRKGSTRSSTYPKPGAMFGKKKKMKRSGATAHAEKSGMRARAFRAAKTCYR